MQNTFKTTTTIALMSATGAGVFLSLPLLIGAFIDVLELTEQQAGLLGSSYFGGFFVVSLTAIFWLTKVSCRLSGIVAVVILFSSFLLMSIQRDFTALALLMVTAGVGSGVIFCLSLVIINQLKNTEGVFGWKIFAEQVCGAFLLFTIPFFLDSKYGISGALIYIGTILLFTGSAVLFVRPTYSESAQRGQITENKDTYFWLALAAFAICFGALSGVWAFVERLASEQELTSSEISLSLSISLIGGALGSFIAAFQKNKIGIHKPILISTLMLVCVLAGYSQPFNNVIFAILCFILSFGWNYGLVYQMSKLVTLDTTKTKAVLISPALAFGGIFGPALAGLVITTSGYLLMLIVAVCVIIVANYTIIRIKNSGCG